MNLNYMFKNDAQACRQCDAQAQIINLGGS